MLTGYNSLYREPGNGRMRIYLSIELWDEGLPTIPVLMPPMLLFTLPITKVVELIVI